MRPEWFLLALFFVLAILLGSSEPGIQPADEALYVELYMDGKPYLFRCETVQFYTNAERQVMWQAKQLGYLY